MKRFSGWSLTPALVVLAAFFDRVDIATKALHARLSRRRDARASGLRWLAAWRAAGLMPISGGAAITESQHAGEFILYEADTGRRENITVLSGQTLKAGAVAGRVTLGIGRANIPTVQDGGNGTMTAVSIGPEAEVGTYYLECITAATDGGVFSVTTPSGKALPNATVATPYTSRHINFTINDGGTDFEVGTTPSNFSIIVSTTAPVVVGTGTGTIGSLSLGRLARPGNYKFLCTAAATEASTWELFDPDGHSLGVKAISGTGGTAVFATPQINATITDSTTDFVAGDLFNVAVFNQLNGGKVVAWDPTAVDGRQWAVGVLYDNVDASAGDLPGVIVTRDARIIKDALQWGATITAAQKDSAYLDLAARGVIAR